MEVNNRVPSRIGIRTSVLTKLSRIKAESRANVWAFAPQTRAKNANRAGKMFFIDLALFKAQMWLFLG